MTDHLSKLIMVNVLSFINNLSLYPYTNTTVRKSSHDKIGFEGDILLACGTITIIGELT